MKILGGMIQFDLCIFFRWGGVATTNYHRENGGGTPARSPLKWDIPSKYLLYKVYIRG